MKIKLKPMKKRPLISSSSSSSIVTNLMMNNNNNQNHDPNHNQIDDNPSKKSASNVSEITDLTSKLRIHVPGATSSRFGNVSSLTNDHDYDFPTDFPPDFARASAEFYTPTYQAMKNSAFFSNRQREKSKRLSNASTLYESTIGNEFGNQNLQRSTTYGYDESSRTLLDGFDPEVLGLLPPVPEDFANATPVNCEVNTRPKPFKEFLDEVQSQKERTESGASRKENYTNLLRKLRIKEDAIEAWESKQKSKVEDQLDKLERRLEKKRAKAVQRTHKRLIETEMEAEKRKAIARRAVLKEMSKLQINT